MIERTSSAGRSAEILRAAATAARRFARSVSWEDSIREVLHLLGEAAGAHRAYLFQNEREPALVMRERFEWCRPGTLPTFPSGAEPVRAYRPAFARWERVLAGGSTITGTASELPESELEALKPTGVASVAILPLVTGSDWWGFLGLDDTQEEREWTELEQDALSAAAETLSGAIARADVTEQLAEAEARFRSHVEGLPAITYIEYTDPEHSLGYHEVYISPQIETILGYLPITWMQDTDATWWNSIVHPDDREMIEREAKRTSETGEPFVIEYRIKKSSGEWAWIRDQAYLVREGSHPYWHGLMIDITDRREAEDRSREIEEKYRRLLERLPDSFDLGD